MIQLRETDLPPSLKRKHEAQVRFFQRKLVEPSHLWAIGGITTAVVATAVCLALRLPWWAVALSLLAPVIAVSNSIDDLRWRKTWRHCLEWNRNQIPSRVIEIVVEAAGCWEFEEIEDEGAAFLFRDTEENWLFLFGQEFYQSNSWPCLKFAVRFGSSGGHLETVRVSEKVEPERVLSGEQKEDLIPRNGSWEIVSSPPTTVLDELRRKAGS